MRKLLILALTLISVTYAETRACTSYLITKGATTDGSNLISYAGDSHIRYGQLYFYQRAKLPSGSMQTIYHRRSNKPLGQ
ncbi:MAG: dipeptidase, partial [Bacteroidales bacterium]|nr:dipeptidase [Bacteroidales bacterium]